MSGWKLSGQKTMQLIKRLLHHFAMAVVNTTQKSRGVDGQNFGERNCRLDWFASKGSLIITKDHPKISNCLQTPTKPMCKVLPELSSAFTRLTGFHKVLITDYGVQAYHLALRLAAYWGQIKKKVPFQDAVILATPSSFLGRCFPTYHQIWPNIKLIAFNNLSALEGELWTNNNVCGLLMDTIQWGDSVEEPGPGYLVEVRRTCDKHNVLWLADETSCGLGRTGDVMAYMTQGIQPDIVLLAPTLGCGLYQTGILLTTDEIFAEADSQFIERYISKNSLLVSVALATLRAVESENLANNAAEMGECLREALKIAFSPEEIPQVHGRGLLTAIRIHGGIGKAGEICNLMHERGVSVWKCSDQFVGITPPLNTHSDQIIKGVKTLASVIDSLFEKHIIDRK